ncbi:hypothetical protein [Streptomyces sp. NPDC053079]|uniref:hypothetical protein n=1 Tax=Streptomyces sp. NPDC053079 TaxID=3365697 RepID=UPI0037CF8847
MQSIDEQWKVTWVGDPPKFAVSREYGRGQISEVSWESTFQRGPDGRRRKVETFRFSRPRCHQPDISGSVVAFRVVVICGYWPDQVGAWRTLDPGRSGTSSATCGGGTGVGSVDWQEG